MIKFQLLFVGNIPGPPATEGTATDPGKRERNRNRRKRTKRKVEAIRELSVGEMEGSGASPASGSATA